MKTFATILSAILLAVTSQACVFSGDLGLNNKRVKGNNTFVTKEIKVEEFSEITLAGGGEVIYTQSPGQPKVEVYTSENIVDLLEIKVTGNQLSIRFKKGYNVSYNKLTFRVSSADMKAIAVAGSGDIKFTNGLKTKSLNVSISGSGNIEGGRIHCTDKFKASIAGSGNVEMEKIDCNTLETSIAGSGDIKIKEVKTTEVNASIAGSGYTSIAGTAQEASYSIAGSGDMRFENLEAKKVSAKIQGSGSIKCHATGFLKVNKSGGGSVGYKGNPQLDIPKRGVYKL